MATIRSGAQAALLVVDVQRGVVANAWQREPRLANVVLAVERARAAGVPVIWVQHESDELVPGSEAWQWAEGLAPQAGEAVVPKRFNSAFEDTALEALLAERGIARVVLAGAQSNWCIRATAHAALERGYDLTLVQDAHLADTMELGDGRRIDAAQVIDELNIAMRWMEYPGRRTGVAAAAELPFQPS